MVEDSDEFLSRWRLRKFAETVKSLASQCFEAQEIQGHPLENSQLVFPRSPSFLPDCGIEDGTLQRRQKRHSTHLFQSLPQPQWTRYRENRGKSISYIAKKSACR